MSSYALYSYIYTSDLHFTFTFASKRGKGPGEQNIASSFFTAIPSMWGFHSAQYSWLANCNKGLVTHAAVSKVVLYLAGPTSFCPI